MMKHWHEKYPFRFGVIFMLVYGVLDVADARWFIPKLARSTTKCEDNGTCNWIITFDRKKNDEHNR